MRGKIINLTALLLTGALFCCGVPTSQAAENGPAGSPNLQTLASAKAAQARSAPDDASLARLRREAKAAFDRRGNLDQAREAIRLYLQVMERLPGDRDAAIKVTRTELWLGTHYAGDEETEHYRVAAQALEKAREVNPDDIGLIYWQGVTDGLLADKAGFFRCLMLIDETRENLERVLEENPDYDSAGAYRVLGRFYFKLPGLLGGDSDKAEAYLKKSIEMYPNYWLSYLYLSSLLSREGRPEEARELLLIVRKHKDRPVPGWEPESGLWQELARRYLLIYDQGRVPQEEDCPLPLQPLASNTGS